jgi:hypothetical protein
VEEHLVRIKNGSKLKLSMVAWKVAALAEQGRLGEDNKDKDGLLILALLARLTNTGDIEIWFLVMAMLRRLVGDDPRV